MKIVCLGDSLTYGYGVSVNENWVALATAQTALDLINRGINGDTTGGMLARFYPEVLAVEPAAVLITGGCNDILISGSPQNAKCNLSAMAHQAFSRDITPLIGTPIPIDLAQVGADWGARGDFPALQAAAVDLTAWLRDFSRGYGVPLIDFWAVFERALSAPGPNLYVDGLHPSPAGHQVMADLVARRLTKILRLKVD